MFDFVDDVSTGGEGFGAVACAHAYPDGHVADGEVSDAVYAGGVFDTETGDCFGDDAFAFFDGERLEGFVFEMADGEAFVVVANPTFE
jgi:nitrite reductase/ring-hydroxylating ferredoxin subunit